MELKSIVVALLLLAVLFGWYAWLEAGERRRRRTGRGRKVRGWCRPRGD